MKGLKKEFLLAQTMLWRLFLDKKNNQKLHCLTLLLSGFFEFCIIKGGCFAPPCMIFVLDVL